MALGPRRHGPRAGPPAPRRATPTSASSAVDTSSWEGGLNSSDRLYTDAVNLDPATSHSPAKPLLHRLRQYYHLVSFALLLGLLLTNLFLSSSSRSGNSLDHNHYQHSSAHHRQWCANPQLAGLLEPASCDAVDAMPSDSSHAGSPRPALDEATRIADQFEYPTGELIRGVARYRKQMEEGLAVDGATLSQIPSYITAVPNGTEKVGASHCLTCFSFGIEG